MPTDFTIQLYNPDQQVEVSQKTTSFLKETRWEFSLPQDVFRMPSASDLDRSQNDPTIASTTPKINFAWRKESKFSKEMTCFMTGRSTDITHKKKNKEPDIALAHFRGLKDITIYEPNLYRMELEDQKGFEVALLLCAATIRDVFYARDLGTVFNISGSSIAGLRRESAGSPTSSTPAAAPTPHINGAGAAASGLYSRPHANSLPDTRNPYGGPLAQLPTDPSTKPAALDPRAAWELEAETARLRAAAEAEARAAHKVEERARRERERAAEEETRRLRKVVEKEDRDRQRREREQKEQVEKETERLRKLYGSGGASPSGGTASAPISQSPFQPPPSQQPHQQRPAPTPQFSYGYQLPANQQPQQYHTQQQHPSQQQHPQQQSWQPNAGYEAHFNQSSSSLNPNGSSRPSGGGKLRRKSFLNIMGEGKDADRMRKRSSVF